MASFKPTTFHRSMMTLHTFPSDEGLSTLVSRPNYLQHQKHINTLQLPLPCCHESNQLFIDLTEHRNNCWSPAKPFQVTDSSITSHLIWKTRWTDINHWDQCVLLMIGLVESETYSTLCGRYVEQLIQLIIFMALQRDISSDAQRCRHTKLRSLGDKCILHVRVPHSIL